SAAHLLVNGYSDRSTHSGIGIRESGIGNLVTADCESCLSLSSERAQSSESLLVQLPSRVEIVEVHDCVQHKRVGSVRVAAPDRVVGEEHDVPALEWHVDPDGPLRDRAAVA